MSLSSHANKVIMYIAEHIKGIVKSAFFFCHGESAIRDVLGAKGTIQTHDTHQKVVNQNSQFIKKISCLRQQLKIKKNKPTRARAYAGVNNRLKRV